MCRARRRHRCVGADASESLGSDDNILAGYVEVLQGLADGALRVPVGVDIGGIEEVDAGFDGEPVSSSAPAVWCRRWLPDAFTVGEGHGAETDLGDEEAGVSSVLYCIEGPFGAQWRATF